MARWYSAFSNTNIGSLESLSYQRLAMGGTPSTLQSDLVNTRQALSNAWQPTVNPQNRNGALGIVIPPSVITRASGNFSFTDLYTNTAAIWQSNPSVRPLTAITTGAPSVQVTPVDGGSFADADYANASAAVQALISNIANIGGGTGGGPYSRLGVNPYATMASLHHDHALTYFAWDDYTPGQPTAIAINVSNTQVIVTGLNNYLYAADLLASISVSFTGTIDGVVRSGSVVVAAGSLQAAIAIGATVANGAPWNITARANYSYASPLVADGAETVQTSSGTVNNL